MLSLSCTFIGICLFILGSSGNGLCVLVFLRQKFRYRIITPYFIVLLCADSIYLLLRLIKLLYYSQTLFKLHEIVEKCSTTYVAQAYKYATQTWPQPFIPFVQSETYMRFSLVLMSIMSVQRTIFIERSVKFLVLPTPVKDTSKCKWTCFVILMAFFIAYLFEFAGLSLFCSKFNSRDISYDWFVHMNKYMENTTSILTNTISDNPDALKCVNYAANSLQQNQTSLIERNPVCTRDELTGYLSYYFDQHQRPIVNLIQKIVFNQTGHRISRNEIRRKYHFHDCSFPQEPNFFHRYYDFMYSRIFGLNRHTLILVFGNLLPLLVTIASNLTSLCRVRKLNQLTSLCILPCRRRTDDTRRILLVISVECLFAIVNSCFSDIILTLVYCERNLSAGDDCPKYLQQNYEILVVFDMFNSTSNIILHCLCGKRFRKELSLMLGSMFLVIKNVLNDIWCCYFHVNCRKSSEETFACYQASVIQQESTNSSNSASHNRIYLTIQASPQPGRKHCCDCRWYFNQRGSLRSQRCLSAMSKESLHQNRPEHAVRYRSLTQRTCITKATPARSMRLYYPAQQTASSLVNKNRFCNSQ